jgi:hypothetical protein
VVALPLIGLILTLAPIGAAGLPHPGNTAFRVTVSGTPGQVARLRAVGVPSGYIASFCTPRVCAPFQVALALPNSGRESIELQLIENVRGAAAPRRVTVAAVGARTVSIAFPHRAKQRPNVPRAAR